MNPLPLFYRIDRAIDRVFDELIYWVAFPIRARLNWLKRRRTQVSRGAFWGFRLGTAILVAASMIAPPRKYRLSPIGVEPGPPKDVINSNPKKDPSGFETSNDLVWLGQEGPPPSWVRQSQRESAAPALGDMVRPKLPIAFNAAMAFLFGLTLLLIWRCDGATET